MTETEKKIEKVPVVKSVKPEEKKQKFIEGVKKTVFPAFISAAFAILFFVKFDFAKDVSWFSVVLLILLLSYYIQRVIYPLIGVKVKEFETKDWLYVEFLVIIYFWVIWILLLNQ
ncbi:MAG: hypothetical protein O8C63_06740 [Candidatus Methanoperedens sp.]|nr:hypothetical protein [Candidatus Methanoperedens sp.]